MAFTPKWTKEAADTYAKLQREAAAALENRKKNKKKKSTKAEGLFKQVEKCVRFLLENPNERMRAKFPTNGAMLAFYVGGHFMLHMGQLSAWRRAVGLGPA